MRASAGRGWPWELTGEPTPALVYWRLRIDLALVTESNVDAEQRRIALRLNGAR